MENTKEKASSKVKPKQKATENTRTETKENMQRRPKWRARSMRTLHGRPMQKFKGKDQREHSTEGQNQRPKRIL